jgi:hypothetical protein
VAFNLQPGKDGNVTIDAASLGDRQMIRVAVDSDSAAARVLRHQNSRCATVLPMV